MHKKSTQRRTALVIGVATAIASMGALTTVQADIVTHDVRHTFSINDVQGGFDGSTVGDAGAVSDPTIICGAPIDGSPECPPEAAQPVVDRDGDTLYPVDSEFGFYVVDFLGAQEKDRDNDYAEGWVGNIEENDEQAGIKISNSVTDRYKVKAPLGTWCAGLGGNSVKCSTEHYTVMEHVLSCHEVVPYFFANPEDGTQALLSFPDGTGEFDCATAELDDYLDILVDGEPSGERLVDATPGVQMEANDNTSVLDDIAVSDDYSVTLKDDGKALYRWGALIKRPNDLRMYVRMELPQEWKDNPETDFPVSKARLLIDHWITNNPNDQLRPEDMENEGATGRKPSYRVDSASDGSEIWLSTKSCFEGDGDFIDIESDPDDPHPIGVGTYFKNGPFVVDGTDPEEPLPFSSDLTGAFTNGFYTTIDRDPFEWSYRDTTTTEDVYNFIGSALSDDTLGELISGPRWRLKANKYGQDIPGLEVIRDATEADEFDCVPPPPAKEDIKYTVGERVVTEINLLDFEDVNGDGDITNDSPLLTSKGWIDASENFQNLDPEGDPTGGNGVSINGLPLTEDFDLAVYVKGDRKPTAIYSTRLIIEYEGEGGGVPPTVDVALTGLDVPDRVLLGDTDIPGSVSIKNTGSAKASGTVTVVGVSNRGEEIVLDDGFEPDFTDLEVGEERNLQFTWTAPEDKPATISWTATVDADDDVNASNDVATGSTKVRRN